jgi:hypothetical protein
MHVNELRREEKKRGSLGPLERTQHIITFSQASFVHMHHRSIHSYSIVGG